MKQILTLYRDKATLTYAGGTATAPPPAGARNSYGLSSKQRTRILRAADYLSSLRFIPVNGVCTLCYFVTLTHRSEPMPEGLMLESLGELERARIAGKESKRRLNLFLKLLRKWYPSTQVLWVCEIQPKRYFERGEIVPHYHILMFDPPPADFIRSEWSRIDSGDLFSVVDVQISRNPAAYLAKYLAKGSESELPPVYGNRVGIDRQVSAALKPIHGVAIDPCNWYERFNLPRQDYGVDFDLFLSENYAQVAWGFKNTPIIASINKAIMPQNNLKH